MTAAIANTTTTVTVGEGGLGAYMGFCDDMASTCENGIGVAETTLADMTQHGWGGEKTEHIIAARDQLAAARDSFKQAKDALQNALGITEQYTVNPGAGDRESVTNI